MFDMAQQAFSGSFDHSLDGKGRVIIPASYRDALGENFTVSINPSKTAVAIYPLAEWERQLDQLAQIDPLDMRGMGYVRSRMSVSFANNTMDAQGRVLIPQKLRAKVGLARDVVFVGIGPYTEIWDADAFAREEERIEQEEDFRSLADYIHKNYPATLGGRRDETRG